MQTVALTKTEFSQRGGVASGVVTTEAANTSVAIYTGGTYPISGATFDVGANTGLTSYTFANAGDYNIILHIPAWDGTGPKNSKGHRTTHFKIGGQDTMPNIVQGYYPMANMMVGAYVGTSAATRVYVGATLVYSASTPEPVIDYSSIPFTIEALESGDFYIRSAVDYSLDGGDTWNTTTGAATLNLSEGDIVQFKKTNVYVGNTFTGNTAITFNAYGNIMSLVYGDNFIGETSITVGSPLTSLFSTSSIVDASNLILPATELGVVNAYYRMFNQCSGLTAAPELPATTLANNCYKEMFYKCTSLTTAPELPATTLANNCYEGMFSYCANLTTAPELPAQTLVDSCYKDMFKMSYAAKNTILNYLKCLAIDISASNCLSNWVQWVTSPTGTFVKDANATWPSGNSGIPNGWTVVDA